MLFICISWILFAPTLFYDFFVLDDQLLISNNPFLSSPTPGDLIYYWTHSKSPVFYNFLQIISLIFSNKLAFYFRGLNIILHGLNYALAFIIGRTVMQNMLNYKFNPKLLILSLSICLMHPLNLESIIWVSSIRSTLSTLFALISFYFFLQSQIEHKGSSAFIFASFILYIISILIKPATVLLPLLFILIILFLKEPQKRARRVVVFLIPIPALAYLYLGDIINLHLINDFNFQDRLKIATGSLVFYLNKIAFPKDLQILYGYTPRYWVDNIFYVNIALVVFIFWLLLRSLKNSSEKKIFLASTFAVIIFLLPTTGIVPFDFEVLSTVANRYTYTSLIFSSFVFYIILAQFEFRKSQLACFSVLVLFFYASSKQSKDWQRPSNIFHKSLLSQKEKKLNYKFVQQAYLASLIRENSPDKMANFFNSNIINKANIETSEYLIWLKTLPSTTEYIPVIFQIMEYVTSLSVMYSPEDYAFLIRKTLVYNNIRSATTLHEKLSTYHASHQQLINSLRVEIIDNISSRIKNYNEYWNFRNWGK